LLGWTSTREVGVNDAAAVFVHGLFSSSETWEPLVHLLRETDEIVDNYDFIQFKYSSPKWNLNPSRRIPDFGLIAASLKTFMETDCETYRTIVFMICFTPASLLPEGDGDSSAGCRDSMFSRPLDELKIICRRLG
jgi:hypothetical protein